MTWFEGKSAQDIRQTIEGGLSAPGGKLWHVQEYVRWAHYRVSKQGRQAHRLQEAVV